MVGFRGALYGPGVLLRMLTASYISHRAGNQGLERMFGLIKACEQNVEGFSFLVFF